MHVCVNTRIHGDTDTYVRVYVCRKGVDVHTEKREFRRRVSPSVCAFKIIFYQDYCRWKW